MAAPPDPRVSKLYQDCQDLARYIAKARREISEMRPEEMKQVKLPRAGLELEAIVQATEEATGNIMTAAEEIMAADISEPDAYKTTVDAACMRIFEACSFQDITGQRITKVVHTLTYIEERLNKLQSAWGPDLMDAEPVDDAPSGDAALLNGPALAGEGIDQAQVDAMLNDVQKPAKPNGGAKQNQADIDAMFD